MMLMLTVRSQKKLCGRGRRNGCYLLPVIFADHLRRAGGGGGDVGRFVYSRAKKKKTFAEAKQQQQQPGGRD
jgi:hypothetical protein